jgi:hypothetical protein
VLGPVGPILHCGVDADLQWWHCFDDFRGCHGFLFLFCFFSSGAVAGAGDGDFSRLGLGDGTFSRYAFEIQASEIQPSAGDSAEMTVAGGGRCTCTGSGSASAGLSRILQALQSAPCPIGWILHCGVSVAPHCTHCFSLFAAAGMFSGVWTGRSTHLLVLHHARQRCRIEEQPPRRADED